MRPPLRPPHSPDSRVRLEFTYRPDVGTLAPQLVDPHADRLIPLRPLPLHLPSLTAARHHLDRHFGRRFRLTVAR